jgi:O-antigen ligase
MASYVQPKDRYGFGFGLALIWLTVAAGFYVQQEPAPYDLMLILMTGGFLLAGLIRIPSGSGPMFFLLTIFILANFLSSFFSFDFTRTIFYMGVTFYLALSTILVTCLTIEDEDRVLNTIWSAYIVAAAISSVLAIIGYFHLVPGSDVLHLGGRARAFFKDPNVLGPFLVPVAVYLFARFESSSGRTAFISFLLLPLVTVGILLTFSRGAWANLILSFMLYLVLRLASARRGAKLMKVIGSAVAIAVIGTALVSYLVLFTEAGETFNAKFHIFRYYDADRFSAQGRGLEEAFSSPLGIGPGLSEQALAYAAHSLYVRLFLENGWIGGLSFLAFLVLTFWRSMSFVLRGQAEPRALVVFACLGGLLLNSVVIDSIHWRHFWLLLGMAWGTLLAAEHREQLALERAYADYGRRRLRESEGPPEPQAS